MESLNGESTLFGKLDVSNCMYMWSTASYLFISLLIEEYVGVEELHQQLDLDRGVHTLLSYPISFLETLQHSLWVLTLHTNTMVPMIIIRVEREESVLQM